jgi:hypothetical protein
MDRAAPGSDMTYDQATLKMIACRGWSAADIERMRERLAERSARMGGVAMLDWWEFPGPLLARGNHHGGEQPGPGAAASSSPAPVQVSPDVGAALAAGISAATGGSWKLTETQWMNRQISAHITTPEGTLVLLMASAQGGKRSYRSLNGVAYWYQQSAAAPPSPHTLQSLDRVITRLNDVVPDVLREEAGA